MQLRIQSLAMLAATACVILSCSKSKNDDPPGGGPNDPDPREVIKYLQSYRTVQPEGDAIVCTIELDQNGKYKGYKYSNGLTGFDAELPASVLQDFDDKMNLVRERFTFGDFSHDITYNYGANGEPTTGIETMVYLPTGQTSTVTMQYTVADKKVTKIRITGDNGLNQTVDFTYKDGNIIREVVSDEEGVFMESAFSFGKTKNPYYAYRLKWCLRPSIHMIFYNAGLIVKSDTKVRGDLRFTDEPADTTVVRADADGYPLYAASVVIGQTDSARTTFTYKP